jgi:hypothetical protein
VQFILPLGVEGLAAEDLSLHLYRNGVEIPLPSTPPLPVLTVTEDASHHYLIDGLPEGERASRYTLTAEYPAGVGHSFVWGGVDGEGRGVPASVVLPVRENGLTADDLGLIAYRDGAIQVTTFTADELTADGDYRVSGWPTAATGATWLLVWSRNGASSWYSWREEGSAAITPSPPVVPGTGFSSLIRSGVALTDRLTLSLQVPVLHYPWIGHDGYGNTYDPPVTTYALVEHKQRVRQVSPTRQILSLATVTIPRPLEGNGAVGRIEPLDPRDLFTLPGSGGVQESVADVEGVVDPLTNAPYMWVVYLGVRTALT